MNGQKNRQRSNWADEEEDEITEMEWCGTDKGRIDEEWIWEKTAIETVRLLNGRGKQCVILCSCNWFSFGTCQIDYIRGISKRLSHFKEWLSETVRRGETPEEEEDAWDRYRGGTDPPGGLIEGIRDVPKTTRGTGEMEWRRILRALVKRKRWWNDKRLVSEEPMRCLGQYNKQLHQCVPCCIV